jgi:hypothetical protein
MPHIALLTIGLLRAPWGDPLVRGFEERIDETFATAAASPGFVARFGVAERGGLDGGPRVVPPAFADPEVQDRIATTLSVWRDAESAFAFSYRGIHGAALRDRHAWFSKVDAPSHVAWWIDEGHLPTWAEAAAAPRGARRRRARARGRSTSARRSTPPGAPPRSTARPCGATRRARPPEHRHEAIVGSGSCTRDWRSSSSAAGTTRCSPRWSSPRWGSSASP